MSDERDLQRFPELPDVRIEQPLPVRKPARKWRASALSRFIAEDEILNALMAARLLITDEHDWCAGCLAVNEYSKEVPVEEGVRFCAIGAAQAVVRRQAPELPLVVILNNNSASPFGIAWLNDQHGHKAVLEVFDRAIDSRLCELERIFYACC